MMSAFLEALHSGRVLLMDGALGTELRRAGLPDGVGGELWNLEKPERIRAVHRAYVEAGADVLLTNTFQANNFHAGQYIDAAKEIIRPCLSPDHFALLSMGPILEPPNPVEFPALDDVNFISWEAYGLNRQSPPTPLSGILIETCSSPRVRFAVKRARLGSHPTLLSLTYLRDAKGRIVTLSSHAPEWFARRAKDWGVAALGVNCGRDMDMSAIIEIIRRYRQETDLPLFARPNAGTPTKRNRRWVWPRSAKSMAARLPELIAAGACMIGGCCGTTPEYIAAFRRVIDQHNGCVRA